MQYLQLQNKRNTSWNCGLVADQHFEDAHASGSEQEKLDGTRGRSAATA